MGPGSRAVKAAVIGYGVSGSVFHAPLIATHPEFILASIVTANPQREARARKRHPGTPVFPDLPTFVAAVDNGLDVDVVVLGTPPKGHKDQAELLMRRGIGVVVDKPFTPSAAEARQLMETARTTGSLLTVFQNRRWDGDFLTVKQLAAQGQLGKVQTFESRFEWFSARSGGWKDTTPTDRGGGILMDVGSHLVDQAIELFGVPIEYSAELVRHAPDEGPDEDGFVSMLHATGVRSRLWMNSKTPAVGPRFHIVGRDATFTSQDKDPQEAQLADGMVPAARGYGIHARARATLTTPEGARPIDLAAGAYPEFYDRLAAALRGDGPLPVDPAESTRVLEILEDIHMRHHVRQSH